MLAVYLAPHFDDAVYSCGGLIHRQTAGGTVVRVVTVCAGEPPAGPLSPFAASLHARWGVSAREAVAARRQEDLAALQRLGAQPAHLGVPDCIYRVHPETGTPLYASEEALFGPLDPAEGPLVERLARELERWLAREPATRLYAPLGIGRHVDHRLTRAAAERLAHPLLYYEDYPYAAREPETADWGGLAAGLSPQFLDLDEADLEAYCLAVGAYRSQLSTFWADEAAMCAAVRRFCERAGAGRLGLQVWGARLG